MYATLLRQFRILLRVGHATFKEWAAYRSHMILSLAIGPLAFILQVAIWQAVFQGKTVVGGFTLEQMIAYYGIVTLMNYLVMDFAAWNLQMLIHTGRFLIFATITAFECIVPVVTLLIYGNGLAFPGWGLYEVLLIQGIFLMSKGITFPLFIGMWTNVLYRVREGHVRPASHTYLLADVPHYGDSAT